MNHSSPTDPQTTLTVKLPALGEGADSGEVIAILVAVGDQVAKDQTLIELENAKAVAPIPSPASGRVAEILVKEGATISVGAPIVTLALEASQSIADPPLAASPAAAAVPAELTSREDSVAVPSPDNPAPIAGIPVAASPTVRRYASDLGIDLERVAGSERGGRIVVGDLRRYVQGLIASQAPGATPAAPAVAPVPDFSHWGPVTKEPLSGLRKTIATRLAGSWNTIPHVTQFDNADITDLLALKREQGPAYQEQDARLTLTGLLIQALIPCLKEYAPLNASLDAKNGELIFKNYYHLGIAVDAGHGLVVPVIRNADQKSLLEISRELVDLGDRARQRKLTTAEMEGGTFTISNQGGIGGEHFTPIINAPEVAILGVGQGHERPAIVDGEICARTFLPLCLSYDHRLIDGGTAARFVSRLIRELENYDPERMKI